MISLLFTLALAAQQDQSNLYDAHGTQIRGQGGSQTLLPSPEILHRFQGTFTGGYTGLARNGTMIAANGNYDAAAVIYLFDENSGDFLNTIPVPATNYFGLGYDSLRDRYIATRGVPQEIAILDANGGLISIFPSPLLGRSPVGAAYDSTRDVYWITTYPGNFITSIDPTTGTAIQTFQLNVLRVSDCGYDPVHDVVVFGARDFRQIYFMDPEDGTTIKRHYAATFPVLPNSPPGLTFSSSGDLWESGGETDRLTLTSSRQSRVLDLQVHGSVPGRVTIEVYGATPWRRVSLAYGLAGSFTAPAGACAGVTLAIDNPMRPGFFPTKTPGKMKITPFLSSAMIGMTLQAVDMNSCTVSNTVVL